MSRPLTFARSGVTVLGHFAVTPACYMAAVSLLGHRLLNKPIDWYVVAAVGLLGWAAYIFDRVKLKHAWLDPADNASDPLRAERLTRFSGPLRVLGVLAGAAAILLLAAGQPVLAAMPPIAAVFIWLYAGSPSSPRLKRSAVVKTPLVALAIAGTGVLPPLLETTGPFAPAEISDSAAEPALAAGALWLIAMADIALCDLDHRSADGASGVRSVPVLAGSNAPRIAAFLIALGAILAWLAGAHGAPVAVLAVSAIPAWFAGGARGPTRHRDWVEWRLVLAAALWV